MPNYVFHVSCPWLWLGPWNLRSCLQLFGPWKSTPQLNIWIFDALLLPSKAIPTFKVIVPSLFTILKRFLMLPLLCPLTGWSKFWGFLQPFAALQCLCGSSLISGDPQRCCLLFDQGDTLWSPTSLASLLLWGVYWLPLSFLRLDLSLSTVCREIGLVGWSFDHQVTSPSIFWKLLHFQLPLLAPILLCLWWGACLLYWGWNASHSHSTLCFWSWLWLWLSSSSPLFPFCSSSCWHVSLHLHTILNVSLSGAGIHCTVLIIIALLLLPHFPLCSPMLHMLRHTSIGLPFSCSACSSPSPFTSCPCFKCSACCSLPPLSAPLRHSRHSATPAAAAPVCVVFSTWFYPF